MKVCGSEGIAPHILNLSIRWRQGFNFTPELLYSQYPLNRRLGRPQSQSGCSAKEKKSLSYPARNLTLDIQSSLFTVLPELPRLQTYVRIIQ
jgi:hypothetical protein